MALVIERRRGQSVIINTGVGLIRVKLGDIRHVKADFVIEAPRSMRIVREELFDKAPPIAAEAACGEQGEDE